MMHFLVVFFTLKICIYFISILLYFCLYVFIVIPINRFIIKFYIHSVADSFPFFSVLFEQFVFTNRKRHCFTTIKMFNIANHLRKLCAYRSNDIIIIIYDKGFKYLSIDSFLETNILLTS